MYAWSLGGGTGAPARAYSVCLTRCSLGSSSELVLLVNIELVENVDAERRRTRGAARVLAPFVDRDVRLLRVEELVVDVDGLIRDGTSVGRGGDEDRLERVWVVVVRCGVPGVCGDVVVRGPRE